MIHSGESLDQLNIAIQICWPTVHPAQDVFAQGSPALLVVCGDFGGSMPCTSSRWMACTRSSPTVCTCSDSQVCDSFARGFLCNPTDNLCERLYFKDTDCSMFKPLRTCAPVHLLCQSPPQPSCSSNANCVSPSQPHCDVGSSHCVGCVDGNLHPVLPELLSPRPREKTLNHYGAQMRACRQSKLLVRCLKQDLSIHCDWHL